MLGALTKIMGIANFIDSNCLKQQIIPSILEKSIVLSFGLRYLKYLSSTIKIIPSSIETIDKMKLLLSMLYTEETLEKYQISKTIYFLF